MTPRLPQKRRVLIRWMDIARCNCGVGWTVRGSICVSAVLVVGGGQGGCLAGVQGIVVEALGDEDEVGDAEIDCEGDDCWDKTGPDGA